MATRLLLAAVRFYRQGVGPFLTSGCRFAPGCSAYAEEALGEHGSLKGGWLTLRRLARCHPFGGRGFDPVPATYRESDLEYEEGSDPEGRR